MPLFKVETSATPDATATQAFLSQATKTVAETLGKPERVVMISLKPGTAMMFGGDTAPTAYAELKGLDLPEDRTGEFAAALCGVIEDTLGVPANRIFIEFASPARHMFAHNGKTFA